MKKRSQQFIILVVLFGVIFSFAMFQGGFVSWFIFYSMLPFIMYSACLLLVPIQIERVERQVSAYRVERGRSVDVTVHVRIRTPLPLLFMTLREVYGETTNLQQTSKLFLVGLKREFTWTYTLVNLPRGIFELEAVELTTSDFLGWIIQTKTEPMPLSLIVYPQSVDIVHTALKMQYEQGSVAAKYNAVKDNALVSGLRNYQPGDRFSSVHWKSFARTGELRTKEFEDRQSQNITVCIDRFSRSYFEEAVDLTASIVKASVQHHNDIAFISGGEPAIFFPAVHSEAQLQQVLHHLALVQPNGIDVEESFKGRERVLQQSVVMIITGTLTSSILKLLQGARAKQVIVILTDTTQSIEHVKTAPNSKLIKIDREQFHRVFSEVNKR